MLDIKKLLTKILTALNDKVNRTGDTFTGSVNIQNGYLFANRNDNWCYLEAMGQAGGKARLMSAKGSPTIGLYGVYNDASQWSVQHDCSTNETELPALVMSSSASGTVGSSFSGATQKYCYLYKIGKIVFMSMSLGYSDNSTTIATGTTLFTIPTGYRPKAEARLPAQIDRKTSAQSYPASIAVATNGNITQATSSAATGIYCFGMWETS